MQSDMNNPAGIYLFEVCNANISSGIFNIDFEQ